MNSLKSFWSERLRASVLFRRLVAWSGMSIVLAVVATFLPLGFDYIHVFHPHIIPIFYVPWTDGLMYLLPWPILVSATVMALIITVQQHGGSPWTIVLAILSLPTMWVLFIGQLEGVALLGLLLLPWSLPVIFIERRHKLGRGLKIWGGLCLGATLIAGLIIARDQGPIYYEISKVLGQQPQIGWATLLLLPWVVPIVLLKPQLTAFALLSRRSWWLAAAVWLGLSILIWGFWPPNLVARLAPEIKAVQPQDVSLFPWSLIIAVPMLWLARGDAEMLMAAGALAVPTVHPYQYIVLMPALARMPLKWRMLCWASSFLPLTANYFGPQFWLTGNIFPVLIWLSLWIQRRRQAAAL